MSKKVHFYPPIWSIGFSLMVNILCIIFVGWKTTECFIKYFEYPIGTKVNIELSSHIKLFPSLTICAVDVDEKPSGLRWNISHLSKCGIQGGADEYKTKWVGHGNESMCTDPKLLWESIVVKLEDMVSFVEFEYYHDNKGEKYTSEQMQDIVSTLETSKGRCYSLTPNSEMIKQGIRHVYFELVSLSKIHISHSGTFEYTADKIKAIKNLMGNTGYYEVDYELFDMLDDKSTTCNNDPKYGKDKCAQEELEKYLIKEFGCTPPFFENKEKICTNETISKQVWEYWNSKKYYTKCPDPCRAIEMIKAIEMENKITKNIMSGLKLYFHHRGKVVKSYYAYSGLSLIAEIGGYFGLFLGVSINQITYVTSFVQERVQNYL